MSKLLISKKGVMKKSVLFAGLLAILTTVAFFALGMGEHEFGNSKTDDFIQRLPMVLLGMMGILCILMACATAKTRVSVYDDHIEGSGVDKTGLAAHQFHFEKSMKYTVQRNRVSLVVSCGGETFRIFLSSADAQAVFRCVTTGAGSYSEARPQAATQSAPKTTTQSAPKAETKPGSRPTFKYVPTSAAQPKPQPAVADKVMGTCPQCKAQLRVPAGKGRIRVNCPKCGHSFQMET